MRITRLAFLVACAGCGLLSGLDQLTLDGGSAASDGGNDAAADAPIDVSSCTPPTFCSSQTATFCADFDEPGDAGWSNAVSDGAVMGTSQAEFVSCPSSLVVDMPPVGTITPNEGPRAVLTKTFTQIGVTQITVDIDLLLPQLALEGFVVLAITTTVDDSWWLDLEHSADGSWFLRVHQGASTSTPSAAVTNPLLGAWNHMRLTVPVSTSATTVSTLTYATTTGAATVMVAAATIPTGGVASPEASLNIGAIATSTTSEEDKFYFDNVLCTLQ